jgi:hypothetical protein
VSQIIVEALDKLDMHYPPPRPNANEIIIPD